MQCEQSVYINENSNLAVGPDGYYSLDLMSSKYLTYIDKASARETYLCSRPDCPHVDESGYHILETCDAYVGSAVARSIVYHNGYVYVLKYDPESYNVTLVKISADGSVHEDLMVVGQAPDQGSYYQYVFLDDDTIVMTYKPTNDSAEESMASLERIDLNRKEKTAVYTYTGKGASLGYLKVVGQEVFFIQMTKLEDDDVCQLMKWNAMDGQVQTVLDKNMVFYTIASDGKLFYYMPREGLYRYNLNTREDKLVRECDEDTMYALLACDGNYVYLDNFHNRFYYDEQSGHNLYVCDLDGNTVNTIPMAIDYLELTDQHYLFTRSFVDGKLPGWAYIRKEDITDPNVTWSIVGE